MSQISSEPKPTESPPDVWDDETIRNLNRHMRIKWRYLSSAVRQMTLRQCLEEVHPSEGEDSLIRHVDEKLTL